MKPITSSLSGSTDTCEIQEPKPITRRLGNKPSFKDASKNKDIAETANLGLMILGDLDSSISCSKCEGPVDSYITYEKKWIGILDRVHMTCENCKKKIMFCMRDLKTKEKIVEIKKRISDVFKVTKKEKE